jgi:hypothetical protein
MHNQQNSVPLGTSIWSHSKVLALAHMIYDAILEICRYDNKLQYMQPMLVADDKINKQQNFQ